jgi:uncharacterized protein with FMN-binding domain
MRRIAIAFMSTISALVVLFSYHTSTNSQAAVPTNAAANGDDVGSATTGTGTSSAGSSDTADPSTAASPSSASSSASGSRSSSSTSAAKTYTGDSVDTRWGPVQVAITVQNGRITKAVAVVYPHGNGRDQEINSYALPVLGQEVTQAQSASIDAVSGATVTSDGYIQSLQSAIDQAHL